MMTILGQTIAACIGTVAFSLLFGIPKQFYPYCGVIGAAGWLVYSLLDTYTFFSAAEATFAATMVVILLSRMTAVRAKCPVTVFLISGIFPLVPGGGIYWTAYYLVTDQTSLAVSYGFSAIKAAIAIVLGIVAVFEFPGRWFLWAKRKSK